MIVNAAIREVNEREIQKCAIVCVYVEYSSSGWHTTCSKESNTRSPAEMKVFGRHRRDATESDEALPAVMKLSSSSANRKATVDRVKQIKVFAV
jgi:hypothetical protein